ncbi:GOLPH3/VPS74 family protein [Catenulispora rubra]|uniref:GOLPH3/VPS74 family protein n=1 Tax=Catenulispora rubra TaxID=280293 RepID=UPI0018923E16|nr:GPP34 family phosphoprotein [Catenulispora rubra]
MTLGEGLLLLAVHPRNGRVRNVERMSPALRAVELIELSLAGRVAVEQGRIVTKDPSSVGHRLLDHSLSSLSTEAKPPKVEVWLRGKPAEAGTLGQYIALLGRRQVIRIEYRGQGLARTTRITVRDHERLAEAWARIDAVAHGEASATVQDQALAGIVHVCGLGSHLYRGPHRLMARRRLARFTVPQGVAESVRSVVTAADVELANAVAEALSSGIAKMTKELTMVLRQEYRLEMYSSHSSSGGHHHTSIDTSHSGHHQMGSGDVGGGHHHHG